MSALPSPLKSKASCACQLRAWVPAPTLASHLNPSICHIATAPLLLCQSTSLLPSPLKSEGARCSVVAFTETLLDQTLPSKAEAKSCSAPPLMLPTYFTFARSETLTSIH